MKPELLALSVLLAACPVHAGPDVDGALEALIDWPLNTSGDVSGSVGLIGGGLLGASGDLLALVDDNAYTRPVLHGFFSESLRRLALGWSNLFTGGLEGLRADDFQRYPEPAAMHLDPPNLQARIDPVLDGLGGVYVGLTDALGQPLLFLSKAAGAAGSARSIERWQKTVRERYFGSSFRSP